MDESEGDVEMRGVMLEVIMIQILYIHRLYLKFRAIVFSKCYHYIRCHKSTSEMRM